MDREKNLQDASQTTFDICIIGAGASGAGCALDAALRGYSVLLVEKDDFAARTSSKSTKLIHGGVRYLERAFKEFDFAQLTPVRHGLEERHIVLQNAPHLSRPLALITPVRSWFEGLYFSIGLKLYGWFAAGTDTLPSSEWLSKKQMLARMPTLNPALHSAVLYYDGQLDDARYCTALVQSAAAVGATVINHASIKAFTKTAAGQLHQATLTDELSGQTTTVTARVFLNCTGPAADHIRLLANADLPKRMRPSKGVHLVLPMDMLQSDAALLIPKTPDDRVVFAIPFQGVFLLGTTDTEEENVTEEPMLTASEIEYLLETARPYFAEPIDATRIKAGFGGLRPLIAADPGESTRGLVRDHEVEHDAASGLVSLLGGKWTTYRLMAKDTIDYIATTLLPSDIPCTTAEHVLAGGENYQSGRTDTLREKYGLDADIAEHLHQHYGSRADRVGDLVRTTPVLGERLHPQYPYIAAEVVYTVREEMVRTIRDFLARRIRLEIFDWAVARSLAPAVARQLATELQWSDTRREQAVTEYQQLIDQFIATAQRQS